MIQLILTGQIDPIPNTQLGSLGSELRARCRLVNEMRRRGLGQDWEDAAVAHIGRRGPTIRDGQLVAECWRCMDFGYISVAGIESVKRAWNYDPVRDEPKFTVQPMAMSCCCERGLIITQGHRDRGAKPIGQYTPGAEERHALFFIDGPTGIINQACLSVERGEFDDISHAKRAMLHYALKEFDARKHGYTYTRPPAVVQVSSTPDQSAREVSPKDRDTADHTSDVFPGDPGAIPGGGFDDSSPF